MYRVSCYKKAGFEEFDIEEYDHIRLIISM